MTQVMFLRMRMRNCRLSVFCVKSIVTEDDWMKKLKTLDKVTILMLRHFYENKIISHQEAMKILLLYDVLQLTIINELI